MLERLEAWISSGLLREPDSLPALIDECGYLHLLSFLFTESESLSVMSVC